MGAISLPAKLMISIIFFVIVFKSIDYLVKMVREDAEQEFNFLLTCRLKEEYMYNGSNTIFLYLFYAIYCILFLFCINKGFFIPLTFLGVISMLDIRINIVPDFLVYTFIWSGMLINTYYKPDGLAISPVYSVVACYLFFYLIDKIFPGINIAGGDLKVLAGVGGWFGLFIVPWFLIALLILILLNLFFRNNLRIAIPGVPVINTIVFVYLLFA